MDEWVHIFMLDGFNENFYSASFVLALFLPVNVCIKNKGYFKMHLKVVAAWSNSLRLVIQQPYEILETLATF